MDVRLFPLLQEAVPVAHFRLYYIQGIEDHAVKMWSRCDIIRVIESHTWSTVAAMRVHGHIETAQNDTGVIASFASDFNKSN